MLDALNPKPGVPLTFAGADDVLVPWVASRMEFDPMDYGPCTALGVWLDGEIVFGVVYNEFRENPQGNLMSVSVAQSRPGWATRRTLRDMFRYPFEQMNVTRLWTMASRRNKRARKINERVGFRFEGVQRRGWDGKVDAFMYSMMPEECRWLER